MSSNTDSASNANTDNAGHKHAGLVVGIGPGQDYGVIPQTLRERGVGFTVIREPYDCDLNPVSILLLDAELLESADISGWTEAAAPGSLIIDEALLNGTSVDLVDHPSLFTIPTAADEKLRRNIFEMAARHWLLQKKNRDMESMLDQRDSHITRLTEIAIALSAEKNLTRLLALIIEEAQDLACCDAASMFLIDRQNKDQPELVFKLTANDSIDLDFKEFRFPMDDRSLAGYVATHAKELIIDDAYEIGADAPFAFNRVFDEQNNYRTRSMLTLPMLNFRGEVIGVLQFINKKINRATKLSGSQQTVDVTLPFTAQDAQILRALASESAVAIENNILLENINRLFSGFIQASVMAIEQRDPTTSGHSFRVADLTTELAKMLPQSPFSRLHQFHFSAQELLELRYASLLHDFGKVGVREDVLVKAKKLEPGQFEIIRYRIRYMQERLRREAAEMLLKDADPQVQHEIRVKLEKEMSRLDDFISAIRLANEPSILPDGSFEFLQEIHTYPFPSPDEEVETLINADECSRLSMRKGSLTDSERREIESHAQHTANFLKLIPWTPELAKIPAIASAHHEKLDGTGYPDGLHSDDIPIGSKMMTICDIYDALTASDRPYKRAMPVEGAYAILEAEAKNGKVDSDLVRVFIDAKVDDVLVGKDYRSAADSKVGYAHHVCDMDLHIDHDNK